MKEDDIVYLASAGYDHTIRFWSPHEGKCTRVIQHTSSQVNDLKITPDKKYLAAATFQHVRMYNILINVHEHNPEINLEGFNNNVLSICFPEDSNWLFSGGEDCVTRLWDLRHRQNQSQQMHQSESAVNSVKLHQNQVELFIGQQHGHINIWDIRYNNATPMVRLQQQHPSNFTGVQSLSLNPMYDMLAALDNVGNVHIYSPAQTLTLIRSWKAHSRYGMKCLFSPNGKYLVTTSADHTARVWKTSDILNYSPDDDNLRSTSQANDSLETTLASTLTLEPIVLASTTAKKSTKPTTNTPASLSTVVKAVSNNVISSTSSSPSPYEVSSCPSNPATPSHNQQMKPYRTLTTELQRWVWDAAFSADSQFLITASSDSIVRLWHLETAVIRREYTGHQKAVTALAFSD